MISVKEVVAILLAIIVLAFSNSFIDGKLFLTSLIFFAIIVVVYVASKKLMAYYLQAEEETKIWSFQRYGWYTKSYFKNPIPIGIILGFLLTILSFGWVKWFAVLESDVKTTVARAARKHDFYSYSELTEWHVALISAAGILACFILAIVAYLVDYSQLARLAIFYSAFNLLPIGKLDGTRIFFGSRVLYTLIAIVALIGLSYAFFIL